MFGTIVITLLIIYMVTGAIFGAIWCLKHYRAGRAVKEDLVWGYLATIVIFMCVWPTLTERMDDFHV